MEKAEWGNNIIQLDVDYLYGEQDGEETNNKLVALLEYDYKFAKHISFDYLTGYKDDKFSGFAYQFFTGPGLKYHLLETDSHDLEFQTNIVYSRDLETDKYYMSSNYLVETKYPYDPIKGPYKDPASGDLNEYAAFLIKGDYTWQITDSFKFIQMLAYRVDAGNKNTYFVNSKSGIESEINKMFSLGMNYKVTYVNEAPSDNEHTDTIFTVALIINY
jgi:putative salt-induced outer membrane protein